MRIQFWKPREDFPCTTPRYFCSMSQKKKNNLLKKLSQKFFFGPANFIFGNPTEIFPTRFRKNSFCCPKIKEKSLIWKTFFSLKCFYGHVECSCKKPAKKEAENVCSVSKRTKNFNCFREQFFFQKTFPLIRRMQFWQADQTFPAQLPEMIRKSPQKIQKLFKNFFFGKFPWRGRKPLGKPADFFWTASRKFSTGFSKKEQFLGFPKDFHLKVSIETENLVLTTPLLFCENWSKKSLSVRNWKNFETKLSSLKFYLGHVECSYRQKTRQEAENFLRTV